MSSEIDKHIKSLLEEYSVADGADWHAFESKLDDDSFRVEHDIDEMVKSKLVSHQSNEISDWFDFETILRRSELMSDDHAFDGYVKSELSGHHSIFNSNHWVLLKERLEYELEMKRKIVINKSLEIATLFLLLFAFYNSDALLSVEPIPQENLKSYQAASIVTPKATEALGIEFISAIKENEVERSPDVLDHELLVLAADLDQVAVESILSSNESTLPDNDYVMAPVDHISDHATLTPMMYGTSPVTKSKTISEQIKQTKDPSIAVVHQANVDRLDSYLVVSIPQLDMELSHQRAMPLPKLVQIDRSYQKEYRVGLMVSGDFNVVDRPIDINFFQRPKIYGALGWTAGSSIGIRKGKNEFETGIAFSVKSYDPNQLERLDIQTTRYERDFTEQRFSILQIPLHYKRYFTAPEERSLNFYASTGLDLNFVVSTDYTLNDKLTQGNPQPLTLIESRSSFTDKDFHSGLLEGGSLVKNSYATAKLGFGIEKRFGPYSVSIEPNYRYHFLSNQLGPNNEKLSALSVNLGLKLTI